MDPEKQVTFNKRRLTGYLEDTEEIIQCRRDEWEERASTDPSRAVESKRRAARSEKSSPKSKSPVRDKLTAGIGLRLSPGKETTDGFTDGKRSAKNVRPRTPLTEKPKRGPLAALREKVRFMQMSEKPTKSPPGTGSNKAKSQTGSGSNKHKDIKKSGGKDTKVKRKMLPEATGEKTDGSASGDGGASSCCRELTWYRSAPSSDLSDNVRTMGKKSITANIQEQMEICHGGLSSLNASTDNVCPGEPKPNSSFGVVTPCERKLLELCRTGCVQAVQRYLTSRPRVNINARTFEGESPLRIAVKNGSEALVMFLSSLKSIELGDALFYAIQYKQFTIVKLLCESHNLDLKPNDVSSEFPSYVTPLSLAAEVGMYEIIEYLINVRGHNLIPMPHRVRCRCPLVCLPWKKGDPVEVGYYTLHIYCALSRPSYFVHATDDPIAWVFQLHRNIVETANFHVALKSHFLKLDQRIQKFAVNFINECRSCREVKAILSRSTPSKKFLDVMSQSQLPTLMMALDNDQRCFIAHPHVQVVVKDIWQGDYHAWRVMSPIKKALVPFLRLVCVPYIYYLLLMRPSSKAALRFALPLNKMLLSLACYIMFLGLIFYSNIKPRPKVRAPYTYKDVEPYIVVFVVAYTCNFVRQALLMHPRRFLKYGWNIYDGSTLIALWLAVAFWISAQIHYNIVPQQLKDIERKYWGGLDPVLMADGFFVIGSVLAYLRLLFYFQISKHIGPMQVAMESMVKEFIKYSVFWLLILLSFTVALGKYYSYYSGMKYTDPETGNTLKQENGFVDFKSTFNTLFWGIFGLSSYTNADVVIENVKTGNGTFLNKHDFTEFVGYFAFGSYTIMMGIIVINMIIATMSAAFARVLIHGEVGWSVQETHVYTYYMCHSVLAPPFNLLPHGPVGLEPVKKPQITRSAFPVGCPRQSPPPPPPPLPPVSELVKKVVLRYFHTKAEKKRRKAANFKPC